MINRLPPDQGATGFNNMLSDSRGVGADGSVRVDFVAHAASLGAHVEDVRGSKDVEELRRAYLRAREAARTARRPAVAICNVHHETWTEAGACGETGVPTSLSGRTFYEEEKRRQVRWL